MHETCGCYFLARLLCAYLCIPPPDQMLFVSMFVCRCVACFTYNIAGTFGGLSSFYCNKVSAAHTHYCIIVNYFLKLVIFNKLSTCLCVCSYILVFIVGFTSQLLHKLIYVSLTVILL